MTQDILRDDRFLCRSCGRPNQWTPQAPKFSWFEVLAVAGMFLFIGGMLQKWEADHHTYRFENVKVVKKHDAFRYRMKFASGTYETYFCHNYRPCIPEGAILTSLRYEDKGDCWDIAPAGLGYNFRMDAQGDVLDEKGQIVFDAVKDSCQ